MVKTRQKEGAIAFYTIDKSHKQNRFGHAGLVLPPLFITMVFCFGLVMMQSHSLSKAKTAASKHPVPVSATSTPALSSSSLQTATPLTPADTQAPPASNPSSTVSTSPSPANSNAPATASTTATPQASAPASQKLQSASQSNQPTKTISQPVANALKQVLGKLVK